MVSECGRILQDRTTGHHRATSLPQYRERTAAAFEASGLPSRCLKRGEVDGAPGFRSAGHQADMTVRAVFGRTRTVRTTFDSGIDVLRQFPWSPGRGIPGRSFNGGRSTFKGC